jgi:hypothetical protein
MKLRVSVKRHITFHIWRDADGKKAEQEESTTRPGYLQTIDLMEVEAECTPGDHTYHYEVLAQTDNMTYTQGAEKRIVSKNERIRGTVKAEGGGTSCENLY